MPYTAAMKILITNDDGIQAPGIQHLAAALKGLGELIIVAPKKEQSGAGLGITLHSTLEACPYDFGDSITAYTVSGTPADCVKMACSVLLPSPPDIIVSGINRGSNHGRCLLYSGTVGGVIEGAFLGVGKTRAETGDTHKEQHGMPPSHHDWGNAARRYLRRAKIALRNCLIHGVS